MNAALQFSARYLAPTPKTATSVATASFCFLLTRLLGKMIDIAASAQTLRIVMLRLNLAPKTEPQNDATNRSKGPHNAVAAALDSLINIDQRLEHLLPI